MKKTSTLRTFLFFAFTFPFLSASAGGLNRPLPRESPRVIAQHARNHGRDKFNVGENCLASIAKGASLEYQLSAWHVDVVPNAAWEPVLKGREIQPVAKDTVCALAEAFGALAEVKDAWLFAELEQLEDMDDTSRYQFLKAAGAALKAAPTNVTAYATFRSMGRLRLFRSFCPEVKTAYLADVALDDATIASVKNLGGDWIVCGYDHTSMGAIKRAQKAGLKVAMTGVDGDSRWSQVQFMGVDAVLSKNSGKLRQLVAQDGETWPIKLPLGAGLYGYTKCVIDEGPIDPKTITDGKEGDFKWFSGLWYHSNPPPLDRYSVEDGTFVMQSEGVLTSTPKIYGKKGRLPTLPGKDGFYVECIASIDGMGQGEKFTQSFWLFPTVKLTGRPKGAADWFMELDVDEAAFGPGLTGTVHNYSETKKFHIQNGNCVSHKPLDRSKPIAFGAAYDPKTATVSWYVNNELQMTAHSPYVPNIAAEHEYYLIVEAVGGNPQKPYKMYVHSVRAFVPPSSALPEVKRN